MKSPKTIIGRTTEVVVATESNLKVPAKVDTGADASSIWASEFSMSDKGYLSFCLFGKDSEFYTGKRHTVKKYLVSAVRSAHGTLQIRYKINLTVTLEGRKVIGTFTLADRSQNTYPILVGCRLLNKKFIVDVSRGRVKKSPKTSEGKPVSFNEEFKEDPVAFFRKYHHENERGDIV